jgi:hypothetical protein
MQLSTRPAGAVSGRMILTAPIGIIGELFGTVTGDSINFGGPYTARPTAPASSADAVA